MMYYPNNGDANLVIKYTYLGFKLVELQTEPELAWVNCCNKKTDSRNAHTHIMMRSTNCFINGVEIFEHDIVKYMLSTSLVVHSENSELDYNLLKFGWRIIDESDNYGLEQRVFSGAIEKILGNKYENIELYNRVFGND